MPKKRGRKRTRTNANQETPNVDDENILSSDRRTSFTNSVPPERTLASANVPTQRLPISVRIEFTNLVNNQSSQIGNFTTDTTAINHLKTRKTRSNKNINGRKDKNVEYFTPGNTITTKDITNIGTKLKDVVLIGSKIPEEIKSDLRRIHDELLETSLIPVSENDKQAGFSINKCDQSPDIFNTAAYQYSVPTPGKPNSCKQLNTEDMNYPFGFAGQSIKSHGQKLVINVLWSLKNKNIQDILKKGLINAASALLNLNEDTIKRFQKRYEENSIGIETEKKNPPKPVQDIIDEPKKRMLYEILVSYYKANKVPRMNEVREKFIQQVRTEQLQILTSEIPARLFHCGINTFRKILYSNGYKYGKINKRDAVLFDPRIVAWRSKYLKAIQDHAKLDDGAKLPVIYTDETWFDIYSRQSYGWVPRCSKTVQERKDFTFLKHKASHGPRIIIMHAGGENGFVDGMMDVYASLTMHLVLRTPPYNCQLNPIELVWSDVKRLLREQNTDQNLEANIIRARNILQTYTSDSWKRHVGHVKKLEQLYWDGALQFELAMDRNAEMELAAIASEGDNIEILNTEPEDREDSQEEASPPKLPRNRE
ncbi:unnamed protein product [Allacma fusca]|uniref:Uncharacterized protein n=1 Tax=Allacma fusca TaxID=39272 RepID=A0A8J2JMV7_9HEXA|nr:unnamed protein product [Allacma fusca]